MATILAEGEQERRAARWALGGFAVVLGVATGGLVLCMEAGQVALGLLAAVCSVVIFANPFAGLLLYLAFFYGGLAFTIPGAAEMHLQRVLVLQVVVAWLIHRHLHPEEGWARSPLNLLMVGFLGLMALSVISALWKSQALHATLCFAAVVVFYFLAANLVNSQRRLKIWLWAIALVGLWLSVGQITQYQREGWIAQEEAARIGGSAYNFLHNSSDFALAITVLLPLAVALARGSALPGRIMALGIVGCFCWSVICTGARGGALGLAAALFGIWLTTRRKGLSLLAVATLGATLWFAAPEAYRERVRSITSYSEDVNSQVRLAAWRGARRMFADRPLTGVGADNFKNAYPQYSSVEDEQYSGWVAAHSIYYQTLAELGIWGAVCLILFIYLIVAENRRVWIRLRSQGREQELCFSVSRLIPASLFAFLVGGAFLSVGYYPHLYLLAAMTVALKRLAEMPPASTGGGSNG